VAAEVKQRPALPGAQRFLNISIRLCG